MALARTVLADSRVAEVQEGWLLRAPDGAELILLRFLDGPAKDATFFARDDELNGWPPPQRLAARFAPDGPQVTPLPSGVSRAELDMLDADVYERVVFSSLTEDVADNAHVARGAQYRLAGELEHR